MLQQKEKPATWCSSSRTSRGKSSHKVCGEEFRVQEGGSRRAAEILTVGSSAKGLLFCFDITFPSVSQWRVLVQDY